MDGNETVLAVKGSIAAIGWDPGKTDALQKLVININATTTAAYLLARYIFITKKTANQAWDMQPYICERFFQEVWEAMTTRRAVITKRTDPIIVEYRELIAENIDNFFSISGFERTELKSTQQIAQDEARKMQTAYANNIQERMGKHWVKLLSRLVNWREFTTAADKSLLSAFRSALASNAPQPTDDARLQTAQEVFAQIRAAYPADHQFKNNSLHFDIKCAPLKHMNAFFRLALANEQNGFRTFQALPTRTSWVPAYVQIDTKILKQHILKEEIKTAFDIHESWARAVDLDRRIFKPKRGGIYKFQGTLQTDGVGVSVMLKSYTGRNLKRKKIIKKKGEEDDGWHVADLVAKGEQRENLVMADPNQRDLLYCMGYGSTKNNKRTFRFTLNQRNKETKIKKYRRILSGLKSESVKAAETLLSEVNSKTINFDNYRAFLHTRSAVASLLIDHYTHTVARNGTPIHRKLRLSAKIKDEQSVRRLARALRSKFGENTVLVIGDWSSNNARFHQPTKGIEMRRQLRKEGMRVYLLNEPYTSCVCPGCHKKSLSTFKQHRNPRPWMREAQPLVTVNGLLKCSTKDCLATTKNKKKVSRLWNRDTASVLNYWAIVNGQYEEGARPARFTRAHYQ